MDRQIFITSDHHGVEIKSSIIKHLVNWNYDVTDLGTNSSVPVDYPEYAVKACEEVLSHPSSLGILICGTGIGMCMSANKIDGILAGEADSVGMATRGRAEDHINVLCLSADYTDANLANDIVDAFINTEPSDKDRYVRRVKEVADQE